MTNEQQQAEQQPEPQPTLSIYLNFGDGTCREVFEFYRGVFGGEFSNIMTFEDMPPSEETPPMPPEMNDWVMHVSLPIGNGVLMGSDVPPGFGPPITVGSNYSVNFATDSRDEADRVFAALSQGGAVTMELQDMFWGDYFGTVTDRFGINWQVNMWQGEDA